MFDASKLVVGSFYPRQGGGVAEFLKSFKDVCGKTYLAWLRDKDGQGRQLYDTDEFGRQMSVTLDVSSLDIISDKPVKEPVKLPLKRRFTNVYRAASGEESLGTLRETREECLDAAKGLSTLIGVYELPETILIEPV